MDELRFRYAWMSEVGVTDFTEEPCVFCCFTTVEEWDSTVILSRNLTLLFSVPAFVVTAAVGAVLTCLLLEFNGFRLEQLAIVRMRKAAGVKFLNIRSF